MWKHFLMWLRVTSKEVRSLTILFFIWRTVLFVAGSLAGRLLPYQPSFPYAYTLLPRFSLPMWLYSWANFDGVHYLTIAQEGYTRIKFVQAFFPLLPALLLRPLVLFSHNQINILAVGLILTNLAALFALLLWFALIKSLWDGHHAWIATRILILFPTSLFFGALYTESLFFCFVLGCFLAAHKKQWILAVFLAILASSTRVIGIFLVPALCVELYMSAPFGKKRFTFTTLLLFIKNKWKMLLLICLGSLGLLSYMVYLRFAVGDPLAFFHAQSAFGAGRQTSLVLYPQVVFRALKILLTSPFNLKYIAYAQEFLAGTLGLVGIIMGMKYARPSWSVFAVCAFFLPTLTGTFSSMGRYVLMCFPLFLFLTMFLSKHQKLRWIWYILSTFFLLVNTLLFIQGYWVA